MEDIKETDFIKFLGTAGARIVVSKQLRASGGMWFSLCGLNVLVDPGPGCLVRCVSSKPKMDPMKLDTIILSHRHLDHAADVNVMIEAMTEGGFKKRGTVYAPEDALTDDPVILKYIRNYPSDIKIIKAGGRYQLSDAVFFETPIRHQHPSETYGINFFTPGYTISLLVDTRYFPELLQHYKGDVLIINVVRKTVDKDMQSWLYHLSMKDVKEIVTALKPKITILSHFGMTMVKAQPRIVAEELSKETGLRILAAGDGMKFDIKSVC
ncbi:MAG TPA: MBL fold metallo-hydrolase [Candidatus Brocadiaceae bacterium]|nr:MBL fold metallo-hydrolase [Candidatus Brocadiaceae bacterium]